MDTANGKTDVALEDMLSEYWDLNDRNERVNERLRKVENEKSSVSQRIYEKVKADYHRELEQIADALRPLKEELEAHRKATEQELEKANHSLAELEDEVAEAEFRSRVGEYDDRQVNDLMEHLSPRLGSARAAREALERKLRSFDMRTVPRQDEGNDQPADDSARASRESHEARDSGGNAAAPDYSSRDAAPESPATQSASRQESEVAVAESPAPQEEYDPLAALADPQPDKNRDSGSGMLNLLVKTAGNPDRVVPLLPMTMSIGREHDNNIELKDLDVARYHARITYENGRFYIEDLESSTGTLVNGARHEKTALNDGDVITIGSTVLKVSAV